jgi:hypothetical protein
MSASVATFELDCEAAARDREFSHRMLAALVYNEQAYPDEILRQVVNRELDADDLEEFPDRPLSEYPNDVTAAGLAQIEQALAAAGKAYAAARASTDRAALAAAGRDFRYWLARRATACVVPPQSTAPKCGSARQ